jgi:hypothetical protein
MISRVTIIKALIFILLSIVVTPPVFASVGGVSVEQRDSTPLFSSILESAEFGIYTKNNLGEEDFVPTEEVPLIENQGYGWLIELITLRTSVMWREIFVLPTAPETWGNLDENGDELPGFRTVSISDDRRTIITERRVKPESGLIYNSWAVAAGDPSGEYVMHIYVDGLFMKTFRFTVK